MARVRVEALVEGVRWRVKARVRVEARGQRVWWRVRAREGRYGGDFWTTDSSAGEEHRGGVPGKKKTGKEKRSQELKKKGKEKKTFRQKF